MPNHRERLQAIVDERAAVDGLYVEYRPGRGWFLGGEPRWFGDEGDFLGRTHKEAEAEIRFLQGSIPSVHLCEEG